MNDIETDLMVEFPSFKINCDLPEVVVQMHLQNTLSLPPPPSGPSGQVDVNKVEPRSRLLGKLRLDRRTEIFTGDHPRLVISGHFPGDVPAHPGLGTLMRFAGVVGHEYLQWFHVIPSTQLSLSIYLVSQETPATLTTADHFFNSDLVLLPQSLESRCFLAYHG